MSAIEHVLSMLLNVLRSECTVIEYMLYPMSGDSRYVKCCVFCLSVRKSHLTPNN